MLHKTFHQYIILMESLKDTQIITDEEIVEQYEVLIQDNTKNLLLAKKAEDWYPYCDGISYANNAIEMINIFNNFSEKCAKSDESFTKRL